MTYTIQPATPAQAPSIANLIIEAMTPDCCLHFVGPQHTLDDFRRIMTELVASEGTQYSHQGTLVALDAQGQVVGALVAYDGARLHALRQPFIDALRLHCQRDLSSISDETQPGEFYIDSLAVLPAHRRQGIATALLQAAAERARALQIPRLGLLVDQGNPNGQRLYARAGFRQVGTANWGGHPMFHLQRTV